MFLSMENKVKPILATMLFAVAAVPALAEAPRLILVSPQTTIKPHKPVVFELYLYNPNSKPVQAPLFVFYSIVTATMDFKGNLTPGGGTQSAGVDVIVPLQTLQPKSTQHKTIRAEIMNLRRGELAEVYVEIGMKNELRSNSILFSCPP
jgi:hypothetical protein